MEKDEGTLEIHDDSKAMVCREETRFDYLFRLHNITYFLLSLLLGTVCIFFQELTTYQVGNKSLLHNAFLHYRGVKLSRQ